MCNQFSFKHYDRLFYAQRYLRGEINGMAYQMKIVVARSRENLALAQVLIVSICQVQLYNCMEVAR